MRSTFGGTKVDTVRRMTNDILSCELLSEAFHGRVDDLTLTRVSKALDDECKGVLKLSNVNRN